MDINHSPTLQWLSFKADNQRVVMYLGNLCLPSSAVKILFTDKDDNDNSNQVGQGKEMNQRYLY